MEISIGQSINMTTSIKIEYSLYGIGQSDEAKPAFCKIGLNLDRDAWAGFRPPNFQFIFLGRTT